jgi:hypothetical protein
MGEKESGFNKVNNKSNKIGTIFRQDFKLPVRRHGNGLINMEALQTATSTVAEEGLGMQRDLRSIEVGKIADHRLFRGCLKNTRQPFLCLW